jgi:hypothetical protein
MTSPHSPAPNGAWRRGKPGLQTRLRVVQKACHPAPNGARQNKPLLKPGGDFRRASLMFITNSEQILYQKFTGKFIFEAFIEAFGAYFGAYLPLDCR